ncbi:hypothetical protein A8926_2720 [Saccharopolyspora spinosa]|uniref:Uncharacterized protein n=1 Tax=Saccharopolyspora spinosa TaxID=60894 RepID=A0A2N3XWJ2_SACSN|nr:hypothetical protein A8926_2720 [Saccharopolyspora spinosa]
MMSPLRLGRKLPLWIQNGDGLRAPKSLIGSTAVLDPKPANFWHWPLFTC